MKKAICIFLCLMMIFCSGVLAEETHAPDEFFRSNYGRVSFVLPGYPEVFREADYLEENGYLGWRNKVQLAGYGPLDGEYQVHLADMTPAIETMQRLRPGEEMAQYQMNAMMNLIIFYLGIHDGSIVGEPELWGDVIDGRDVVSASFAYAYPDAEGVEYRGKGYMDGEMLAVMMVQADESNLRNLEDMHYMMPGEERAARQAETVTVGRVQFTFPEAPLKTEDEGYWLYEAFSDDFGYMSVEHMEADFSFMLEGDMTMDDLLPMLAEAAARGYQQEGGIAEYELKKLADGMYAFECVEENTQYPAGHGPMGARVLAVFSEEGVYTIRAVETQMGADAYASLMIVDAAEENE